MTVSQALALQVAVVGRLREALAMAGPTAEAVPVFDHQPNPAPDCFVRIDDLGIRPMDFRDCENAEHSFYVRIFDRSADGSARRGNAHLRQLQTLCHQALSNWHPIAGQPALRLLSTSIATGDQAATMGGLLEYTIHLMGD